MSDVDSMVDTFTSYIIQHHRSMEIKHLHAPMKKNTYFKRPTPWITDNIRLMFRLRENAKHRCHKTKEPHHKQYYLDLKHEAAAALGREKCAYFTKNINEQSKDPKLLWRNLKSDVLPDHNERRLPSHFDNPDSINAAFLDVPGSCNGNDSLIYSFRSRRHSPSVFSLTETNQETVLKIIRGLESNARGVDGISLDMLTLTLPSTLQAITAIINKSIESCTFPCLWRRAIVCPIPKVNDPVNLKDLRPISILPCLSKILERVVYLQVGGVCVKNISYAEDMVLLGPTARSIKEMLKVCKKYAASYGLIYNAKKTEFMVFGAADKCPGKIISITLNGANIKQVTKFKYLLDHILVDDLKDDDDVERERRALAVRGN
ncbi:uncharacterized protein LOC113507436, partial [Trichoplusia ni]|uniref:Uncharacterized protein LOC113507436 n=1 Tax=Trichoplusia ni TaxID=7111 RepID=A0A7E5X082_TRINI